MEISTIYIGSLILSFLLGFGAKYIKNKKLQKILAQCSPDVLFSIYLELSSKEGRRDKAIELLKNETAKRGIILSDVEAGILVDSIHGLYKKWVK